MKIAAWVLLTGVLSVPLILSLWLIFPVVSGIAAVLLIAAVWFKRGPSWLRTILQPLLALFLLVFLVWLYYTPFRPQAASVSASRVASVLGATPAVLPDPTGDEITELHRALAREVAVTKFKIQKVASAIDTVRSAESVFMALSVKRRTDVADLGPALEDVTVTLGAIEPEGLSGTLMDRPVLNAVVDSLERDVRAVEVGADNHALSREELIARQDRLPGLLNRQRVNSLPTKLVRLENALQQTLGAKLDSRTDFVARYSQGRDEIVYQHDSTLRFDGSQPRQLDLSNFFPGTPDPSEDVSYQVNGGPSTEVQPANAIATLGLDTTSVVVTRTITRGSASRRILNGRYFLSFSAIDVHWPNSIFPTIITHIRLPEDPDRTWPWTVDTGSSSRFVGVEIPRDSFIFSTPPGTITEQSSGSRIVFADESLTPQRLATNARISIEVLPRWLSFAWAQKNKDLLIVENATVALVMAVLSGLLTVWVELTVPTTTDRRSTAGRAR
jgi:hypothetical protein